MSRTVGKNSLRVQNNNENNFEKCFEKISGRE
jgi:hypothetical protein